MSGRPSSSSSRRNGEKKATTSTPTWPTRYRPIIEQLEDRLTPAVIDLGIGIGTHLSNQSSANQFAFELLRPDSIDIELRASWTPDSSLVRNHLEAWADMVCTFAGLPPLPDGVVGAMNVYARAKDVFDERAAALGEVFAAPAAIAVQNAKVLELKDRL